ncbi:FemAB family XrtA/PEP-CTERM system-associated protein [Thiohalobacter thiocyanaticus]|uniref:FemAB family PEP-CTERM system-associated protein n=1 Tax=Thiohalobacter thiocyanaticus TaxID=585455 RepID=A0A426QMD6_9GAMM|nr:FemAB family XrtA/PEP-CTERM system-associated protein [Thiohalobacter thiocyanaticus]RRQ22826.1 FemAB family PEP-CTERM system-associated protein [Thiohalobacter thiocyanaticus]
MERAVSDSVQIRELDEAGAGRWDAFVQQCPEATFFHRAGWKRVIERTYGHPMIYLYAERDGDIQGVLPLGQLKSLLFGNSLVSTPFCVYGGVAAEDEAVRQALITAAVERAENLRVDFLELRHPRATCTDWPTKDLYVTFRKPLDPDPEVNLQAIPRKQRAMVRKGIQAGLVSEIDAGVERLYDAYSESVRNLGTPVFPRAFFEHLKREFGDDCEILTVLKDGETVAAVMSFYFRDQVLPYYGGGKASARQLKGNDFMYWELMRRSCERGVRLFDFGRSKQGTGSYSFKKNWGFEPEPLYYEYHLVRATDLPNISPTNPKYKLFIELWSKLPLGLSRSLGPYLAKYLG